MKRYLLCGLTVLLAIIGVSCADTPPNTSIPDITEPSWYSSSQRENPDALEAVLKRIDNSTPYQELITKKIDIQSFLQKYDPDAAATITQSPRLITTVDRDFGIECLRQTEAGSIYSIHQVKQGGLLYVFYETRSYESTGKYVSIKYWYYVKKALSYADFSEVTEGTLLKEVKKIDPVTKFYTDRAYTPSQIFIPYSYHYLKDGILLIGYTKTNKDLVVEGTQFWPDFNIEEANYASQKVELYDGHLLPIDALDTWES